MFGSCFDEDCLETRSYILSTGVTFRGTRGSPSLQIQGRIQIAVDAQAADFALVHALAQIQPGFDVATARTALGGWVEPVRNPHLTAIPLHPCTSSAA